MSSKRQRLGPCAECTQRERVSSFSLLLLCDALKRGFQTCDGLYPECDYYRRSMPGPNLRPRQARIRNEQQYLSDRVRELEAELERLSGTTSGSLSPPTSGGSPERSGEIGESRTSEKVLFPDYIVNYSSSAAIRSATSGNERRMVAAGRARPSEP